MSEDANPPIPADSQTLRLAAANALIRRRRSIKPADMSDEAVDPKLVAALLENANWAPTHGMTEPWRFTLYSGDAREELAKFLQRLYQAKTPDDAFRKDKLEKLGRNPLLSPVVMAIGLSRQRIGKIPEIEEIEAVACAVQNMHLTASAVGLGAFWSSPPICDSPEMVEFIGLDPEQDRCLGLFYLGWPKGGEWPESTRTPIEDNVTWKH